MAASEAGSALPFEVYCIPRWQRATWSCSTQTDLPDDKGTQTEVQAPDGSNEVPSSSDTDGEEAARGIFGCRFLRGFKWGNPPVVLSLTTLGVFIIALAAITTITGTVNNNKMENIEMLHDVLEKEDAVDDATSASADTQAPHTAMIRRPRRAWAGTRRATKMNKVNKTASFPKRRSPGHGRTVSFRARGPQSTTASELPTTDANSVPSVTPRTRRTSRSTKAAGTAKRTEWKMVDVRFLGPLNDTLEEVTGNHTSGSLIQQGDDGAPATGMADHKGRSTGNKGQKTATTAGDVRVEEIL